MKLATGCEITLKQLQLSFGQRHYDGLLGIFSPFAPFAEKKWKSGTCIEALLLFFCLCSWTSSTSRSWHDDKKSCITKAWLAINQPQRAKLGMSIHSVLWIMDFCELPCMAEQDADVATTEEWAREVIAWKKNTLNRR